MTKTGAENITWNLSDLYQSIDDPKITTDLNTAKENSSTFAKTYKNKLNTLDASGLKTAYQTLESILNPIYKCSQYSQLMLTTDTSNDAIKALVAKIDETLSAISNNVVFFDLELGTLDTNHVETLCQEPALEPYTYALKRSKDTAQYNLSEIEEKIITLKDLTGIEAHQKLYSELTSNFTFNFEINGETLTLNGSELRNLRLHPDKDVRRRAMKTFYQRYEENELTITHLYNNILKSQQIERNERGYQSAIEKKNIYNNLENDAVAALHQVTSQSYTLVQRYYRLKAKLLNLENDLTLADIYAPLPNSDRHYTYDEAKSIVLDGFKKFDIEIHDHAKAIFDQDRIHAPVQKNKRGGAFCSGSTPDVYPYVMLNFLGKARDVSTMAHELGHAIHDILASKQSLFNYHPILPLAETASVFSEMLITDMLLENETNPKEKIAILTDKLEDIFATSHRQNMFSCFEMAMHKAVESDRLSTDTLCSAYQTELNNMFQDSVIQPKEYQWEWSTIPHIFESPFYVYAYNFGNLLVMALYQQYKEEGETFIPKYKAFLSMGSAQSPKDICNLVGANINDPTFWQKSIVYIESLVKELETLCQD